MDRELIKKACNLNAERASQERLQTLTLSTTQQELQRSAPSVFLERHNPDVGANLVRAKWTPGRLLLCENAPTLHDVAKVHGDETAITWLNIQLRSVDNVRGAMAFGSEALHEARQLIFARYHSVAVVLLLEFFALYKMGEFEKDTERVGGIQKVMVALGSYMRRAQDEANKLIYEQEIENDYKRRMSYGNTAADTVRR